MSRLGVLVGAKRDECGWSRDKAATVSGIGRQTWDDIEKGRVRTYLPKTRNAIMRSLGWTAESWDLILAGGEPEIAPDSNASRVERLDIRFEEFSARLKALEAALEAVLARLPPAPDQPRSGPPSPPAP